MPELDQSAPPAPGNEMTTANSLKVAPERASSIASVASGDIGRDFEGPEGGVLSKERASVDGPPEGGSQAWTVVLGAWCCSFCCYGWINSEWLTCSSATCFNHHLTVLSTNTGIGIFQAHYETHQLKNYSPSTISWITSLEIFFMLFMVRTSFLCLLTGTSELKMYQD
jgi:hypothetical protein